MIRLSHTAVKAIAKLQEESNLYTTATITEVSFPNKILLVQMNGHAYHVSQQSGEVTELRP